MKQLSIVALLAVVVFVFAYKGKNENKGASEHAKNSDKQAEMLKANRAVQRAIETGDAETLRKYIGNDGIDYSGGTDGQPLKGEALIKELASIHNAIDNLKYETIQEAANDEYVFALVRVTGTTKKPVWGMPANYKMDSKSVDVIRVRDMKLAEHWAFIDGAEMMKMMQSGKK